FYNNEDGEVKKLVNADASHLKAVPYETPKFRYEEGIPVIETEQGDVQVSVFGRHNLLNMQGAIAVCMELGISKADCYKAIASFTGAARRLEKITEQNGIAAFRDFAHAPSKLKATL